MATVAPTESNYLQALRTFLLGVLPSGTEVVVGQDNRVPEPPAPNFLVITPMRISRLATNVDGTADALFQGSISGATMTIDAVAFGVLAVGRTVFGTGAPTGVTVTSLGSGSGGVGTYTVAPPIALPTQPLSAGARGVMQSAIVTVQIDVHGPSSADNAAIVATLMRDPYAVEVFANQGFDVVPLYADDPHQAPFQNENQQYENRWVLDAAMQVDLLVTLSQQYADVVQVDVISVDAAYPP